MLKALFDKGFRLHCSSSVDPPSITDRTNWRSFSPLHIATLSRDKEMVAVLIDAGIKVGDMIMCLYKTLDLILYYIFVTLFLLLIHLQTIIQIFIII